MVIRPPDPLVTGVTLACAPYSSAEAVRRLLHLAYRDCVQVLDLTYGSGGFWKLPLPPGIALAINSWPEPAVLDMARRQYPLPLTDTGGICEFFNADYTAAAEVLSPTFGRVFDLVVLDPPHLADAGKTGLMRARYGTEVGSAALERNVRWGMQAAMRHASLGVLVKVADSAHGGKTLWLSEWVREEAARGGWKLHSALVTYRPSHTVDPKHRAVRVPRCNYATYLAFRRDPRHLDFDRLYARQQRVA